VAADYEANWTHWAFTKNTTTGSMKYIKMVCCGIPVPAKQN
jgi:hypothetical protein